MNVKKYDYEEYIFKAPFDKYNTNEKLKIVYNEEITSLLSNGQDVLSLIYKPVGLTSNDLKEDIKNNEWIIGLSKKNGDVIYIPEKYIVKKIEKVNISYQHKVIYIDLGLMPVNEDLANISNDISTLVESRLGILPYTEIAELGSIVSISEDRDKEIKIARNIRSNDKNNYKNKVDELTNTLLEKNKIIRALNCTIKKMSVS